MDNKYFKHIKDAASTALTNPKNVELAQWIGAGPSIRARARLALAAAFLTAVPTLFLGVMRTESVANYAKELGAYDVFWREVADARVGIENVRAILWHLEAQPEIENERELSKASETMRVAVADVLRNQPRDFDHRPLVELEELVSRADDAIKHVIKRRRHQEEGSDDPYVASFELSLDTLASDMHELETRVSQTVQSRRQDAIGALSKVGRDQLILFLLLLFAIPVFVGFAPGWLVAPLNRLRGIAHRIEEGRIRELAVSGRDEISQLARVIKSALLWREELDRKKSAKIFEVRNVLRAVIGHVSEPVFIVDKVQKVTFANKAAGDLIGIEAHHLEGSNLTKYVHSPALTKALKRAQEGDVNAKGEHLELALTSGKMVNVLAHLSAVHDREGGVSRVVLVLSAA